MNLEKEYINIVNKDFASAHIIKKYSGFWIKILGYYPDYKSSVALNKNLPNDILELLSKDKNINIRLTIAMKRKLPKYIFYLLSKDKDDSVRMAIALNKNTPNKILYEMKNDSWDDIVEVVENKLTKF